MTGALRNAAQEILKSHQTRGAAKDVMANLGLNVDHQLLENLEGFRFVFNERIALPVRAQADTVAKTVHLIEMLLPQLVNGAQNRVALDFPERLWIFETDLQLVGIAHLVGNEITGSKLRSAETVVDGIRDRLLFAGFGGFGDVILRYAEREVEVHPIGKRADLPFVEVKFRRRELLNFLDDDFFHDIHEAVADILGVNDLVAEAINDLALLVHHVVVLERAFADLEIMLLDTFLCLANGAV